MHLPLFVISAALLLSITCSSCCRPPAEDYVQRPYVKKQIADFKTGLLALLPPEQASKQAAIDEAAWLAFTSVDRSAAISRNNDVLLYGWLNNILVNSGFRARGLCWHYQQDLYRELRVTPLHFFRIGLTVRDKATKREHNCVYINAKGKGLNDALVLDPWLRCGHLHILTPTDRQGRKWEEDIWRTDMVATAFKEGHSFTIDDHLIWPDYKTQKRLAEQNAAQAAPPKTSSR